MKRVAIILLVIIFSSGCEKNVSPRMPGRNVEFYLITDFQKQGLSSKIINSTVKLSDSVIIYYDDIISYDQDNYTFTLTKGCSNKFTLDDNYKIHGMPFAVTIDKEIVYTGYFWYSFSSSIVDWITIDPLFLSMNNTMRVSLGYPGLIQGDYIPDNRNDQRILDRLRRDGKLIR